MKRAIGTALATLLLIATGYSRVTSADAATQPTVEIKAFAFAPQEITVTRGTTVTWINRDQTAHSVVASQGGFASKGMDTDDEFAFTFAEAGDYAYICSLHPHMTGVVHVR